MLAPQEPPGGPWVALEADFNRKLRGPWTVQGLGGDSPCVWSTPLFLPVCGIMALGAGALPDRQFCKAGDRESHFNQAEGG